MSAYIEGPVHIAALVRAAFEGPVTDREVSPDNAWYGRPPDLDEPAACQLLLDANVASVAYRYANVEADALPGRADHYWLQPVDWAAALRLAPLLSPVAVLKAIDGLDYQSCELPTWRSSDAFAFLERLRDNVTHCLPDYDEAAWSIADVQVIERDADSFTAVIR